VRIAGGLPKRLATLSTVVSLIFLAMGEVWAQAVHSPLVIGLTAEFSMPGSHAAQAIEKGIQLAIHEINSRGGVLGRELALAKRDDRGVPARAIDNFSAFAANPDVVAVFCGRFSPVAIELAPLANALRVPLLDPWAAADEIVRQSTPNFVFRLSLTDTWAMEVLLSHARGRGFNKLLLMLPNNGWGRSSEAAALRHANSMRNLQLSVAWYNWGDTDFSSHLVRTQEGGAQAVIMVANEFEGARIVQQMASLPPAQRVPIISHWGIVAGDFPAATGDALRSVDLVVVQTFNFNSMGSHRGQQVAAGFKRKFGVDVEDLHAQAGFAHAYDLTHLLAAALAKAGSPIRSSIRDAFERIDGYEGLVRNYRHPFGPRDHEALDRSQLFLARFDAKGILRPIAKR
jgi:branched-chain amino acid transport system substrate-binding protein